MEQAVTTAQDLEQEIEERIEEAVRHALHEMRATKWKVYHFLGREWRLCVSTLRKSCEQFCFWGAFIDVLAFSIHWELWAFHFIGKLAFAIGGAGILLLHAEEAL